jgi:hypothetical protein
MPALDTVNAQVTAPGAGGAAMTPSTGDTLQVRSIPPGKSGRLVAIWAGVNASGFFNLTSPRLHDNTRGLRFRTLAAESKPLMNVPSFQKLYDQDQLALFLAGSAVGGQIEQVTMLVWYEELQGINARLIDAATLAKRAVEQVTVEDTITAAAAGGYSGEEAINAESDLLKANTDYALVGYRTTVNCVSVTYKGADTGNLRVSGPGDQLGADYTKDWFLNLSEAYGMPMIPVFNSANRGGILVGVVQNQAGTAVTVSHNLVELA